ncbi:hypothetical protein, partial [Couchioplanes caeruleus]|uniref:hypothetical protein n=1 Tax=Couchioplanes caeruleus TaxID=56438 RepID=UPI00373FD498
MNGWSSHVGAGAWDDEPAWVYEITWEWQPLPGQRYPGDPGRRRAVHHPVYDAAAAAEAAASWDADFRTIAQASGPPVSEPGRPAPVHPGSPPRSPGGWSGGPGVPGP